MEGLEVHVPKLANLLSVHCIGINLPICIIVHHHHQVSLRNCNRTVSIAGHVPDTPNVRITAQKLLQNGSSR